MSRCNEILILIVKFVKVVFEAVDRSLFYDKVCWEAMRNSKIFDSNIIVSINFEKFYLCYEFLTLIKFKKKKKYNHAVNQCYLILNDASHKNIKQKNFFSQINEITKTQSSFNYYFLNRAYIYIYI